MHSPSMAWTKKTQISAASTRRDGCPQRITCQSYLPECRNTCFGLHAGESPLTRDESLLLAVRGRVPEPRHQRCPDLFFRHCPSALVEGIQCLGAGNLHPAIFEFLL